MPNTDIYCQGMQLVLLYRKSWPAAFASCLKHPSQWKRPMLICGLTGCLQTAVYLHPAESQPLWVMSQHENVTWTLRMTVKPTHPATLQQVAFCAAAFGDASFTQEARCFWQHRINPHI